MASNTLNKVMLIGHTGDNVKLHYFDDKNCIGRFPLATNEEYLNKTTNERITNTEWHNIVVRNKAAEICEKYLKKGDKVYIEGRIKTRKWTDDKGNERYTTEIQCIDFTFLSPRERQETTQNTIVGEKQSSTMTSSHHLDNEENNDDLPF